MDKIDNILIVMVGLPRSGKSTWARKQGYPIVNRDSVRLALHGGRFIQEAEDMVSSIVKIMVKSMFLAGHNIVILDECNVNERSRGLWNCNDNLWRVKYKYIDTTKEECLRRAALTNDTEIVPVINRMASYFNFEPIDGRMWE